MAVRVKPNEREDAPISLLALEWREVVESRAL